jgi:putative aminopeptidase FrvX
MDKDKNLEFIKELSDARGVSGFEDEVLSVIRHHGEGLGEWNEDAMRNLYLHRNNRKDRLHLLMLDAHTDEVGFLVKAIRPNGMLDFVALGGWIPSCVPAHRVLVRNESGEWIPGIIASKPPHFLSEAEKKLAPEISEMVIDVGASSDREIREEYRIPIAAPVVPDVSFEYQPAHDIMIGKAFDDRLGCAAVIATLKELAKDGLSINVTGAFAVQEEVGLRGAVVTAQTVKPDVAVVFEGCPSDDTVAEPHAVQAALKKGPMLRHIDLRMITNPRFQRFALDTAREKGIPVQEAVRTGGATNAGAIHLSGMGVPVIVIAIPVRYIHTHYGIASYSDFENSVALASEVIRRLDEGIIAGF